MLDRGTELTWHPPLMRMRYQHWVDGLTGDWLVSRQRFFGVPIPVWYRLDGEGRPVYEEPVLPADGGLPVDPAASRPPATTSASAASRAGSSATPT